MQDAYDVKRIFSEDEATRGSKSIEYHESNDDYSVSRG